MRLVSCVPSLTELVFYLKPEVLVGRTKFCIFPEDVRTIPTVGGTKSLSLEKIKQIRPDIILATKEENVRNQIQELELGSTVKLFDIQNFEQSLEVIQEIGDILGCPERAKELVREIRLAENGFSIPNPLRSIYLIWKNPWMSVGGDTFISSMMEKAGFQNLFKGRLRYPEIDLEDAIRRNKPKVVLFSSEPYPFKEADLDLWRVNFPEIRFIWVDGTYFSWYGSRMKNAFSFFEKIHKWHITQS